MNKLLELQLKNHIVSDGVSKSPELDKLLTEVSDTYDEFEKSNQINQRSLVLNTAELGELNRRLKLEIERQSKVLENLRASIRILNERGSVDILASDDIVDHSKELMSLVAKSKVVKERLEFKNSENNRLNRLMVNRELKMIQLKTTVETLKDKIVELQKQLEEVRNG